MQMDCKSLGSYGYFPTETCGNNEITKGNDLRKIQHPNFDFDILNFTFSSN